MSGVMVGVGVGVVGVVGVGVGVVGVGVGVRWLSWANVVVAVVPCSAVTAVSAATTSRRNPSHTTRLVPLFMVVSSSSDPLHTREQIFSQIIQVAQVIFVVVREGAYFPLTIYT